MRVLHVLNELRPSGAEVMLKLSFEQWKSHGVEPEILSTGTVLGDYAEILRDAGYVVHHLPFSKRLEFFIRFYRFLHAQRFDVVHLHAEKAFAYFAMTAYSAGVPRVVRTIHNAFPFGGWLRFVRSAQRRLLGLASIRYTSVSESVARHERRVFGNETMHVPNWYDSSRFVPASEVERAEARRVLRIAHESFVLVSVSSCAPAKNHQGILHALTLLPAKVDFLYLHVGTGQLEGVEQAWSEQADQGTRVRFEGQHADVLPFLRAADCFLMPSHFEGIGLAAMEGISAGLPSLLSKVSGLEDFEHYCRHVFWCAPDPTSIAKAICQVFSTPTEQRLSNALEDSERIRRAFDVNSSVRQFVDLYTRRPASPNEGNAV